MIMKFSTRARYGLRAMLELALNYGKGPVSVKTISENQEISEAYLEQLLALLGKAGLVKSVRGAQGGYLLAQEPAGIRVGDIIRALEGPIAPVDCVKRKDPLICTRAEKCVSRIVWERIRDAVDEVLDSLTLEDLRTELEKMEVKQQSYMYYI